MPTRKIKSVGEHPLPDAQGPAEPYKPPKRTLQRAKDGFGYVTSDGRYRVAPIYRTSFREGGGGSVSRPSDWRLEEDQDGHYEPTYRTHLTDIRNILKERP